MNLSFYTASGAASAQQKKINVISNNFANINTTAYKSKT
ncbi:MAG: flagellar basal body protein, partial [Hungatella sp.]